ncbi:hypothetical protein GWI33_012636 [Rhynchophorus ferrugineus]|uniref:Uncharacterized protein n=1 Tax=Rhynchophorus ferrugineus TaxID=354439 RepID=A0A834M7E1_RHYFE|nr:hypothetical protein GWI33_012636 [Rhynchophorus ferrugineus]
MRRLQRIRPHEATHSPVLPRRRAHIHAGNIVNVFFKTNNHIVGFLLARLSQAVPLVTVTRSRESSILVVVFPYIL